MKMLMALFLIFVSGNSAYSSQRFIYSEKSIKELITQDWRIDIEKLRESCNFMTDDDIKFIDKVPLAKRNKGMKRHIKHLCESLEMSAWMMKKVQLDDLKKIYELQLIKASYLQKSRSDDAVSLYEVIKMGVTSAITPFKFKFEKSKKSDVVIFDNVFFEDNQSEHKYERFDELAKIKKIEVKDKTFVLFDSVSGSGSAPKVKAVDIKNPEDEWSVKWGDELHSDVVGSRIFAALGFDVDHPYYKGTDRLFLILPKDSAVQSSRDLVLQVEKQFKINIAKFISKDGVIGDEEIGKSKHLKNYRGFKYITFVECALEGRPDRVKRIGSIVPKELNHKYRAELRGALLAHMFIDNWDTREENTLVTVNHLGNYQYKTKGVFSDLGTSFGVHLSPLHRDFRVGLVNEFPWDLVKFEGDDVRFKSQFNSILKPYSKATYNELNWMAQKIALLTEDDLKKILEQSGWPEPIQVLYLNKLASRRAQILKAFDIMDSQPILFDRRINIKYKGELVVKDGVLIKNVDSDQHVLGYLSTKGRLQNYGGKHASQN